MKFFGYTLKFVKKLKKLEKRKTHVLIWFKERETCLKVEKA